MTLQERKTRIIIQLVRTGNEKFITQIEGLLKKELIEKYAKKLKPMTEKELLKRVYRSEEAILAGRVVPHKEVVQYFKEKRGFV